MRCIAKKISRQFSCCCWWWWLLLVSHLQFVFCSLSCLLYAPCIIRCCSKQAVCSCSLCCCLHANFYCAIWCSFVLQRARARTLVSFVVYKACPLQEWHHMRYDCHYFMLTVKVLHHTDVFRELCQMCYLRACSNRSGNKIPGHTKNRQGIEATPSMFIAHKHSHTLIQCHKLQVLPTFGLFQRG